MVTKWASLYKLMIFKNCINANTSQTWSLWSATELAELLGLTHKARWDTDVTQDPIRVRMLRISHFTSLGERAHIPSHPSQTRVP